MFELWIESDTESKSIQGFILGFESKTPKDLVWMPNPKVSVKSTNYRSKAIIWLVSLWVIFYEKQIAGEFMVGETLFHAGKL